MNRIHTRTDRLCTYFILLVIACGPIGWAVVAVLGF